MLDLELNILTLNVWGIPLVSSDRLARVDAIGTELNTGKYDIVSLQEVWSQMDSEKLQDATAETFPHTHYFHSGVIGAGLLVLSKYPILGTLFHAWSLNGYFHRVQHADWFGGKGVGLCRILVGNHIVHLYNAHLHAEYDNENDEYKTHRVIQAFDTAQFIEATRGTSVVQILAGDLNTQSGDLSYKVLLTTSKMQDSCVSDTYRTNECQRNSYTSKRALAANPLGIRIDHIFVRGADHIKTEIIDYKLPFPERVPGEKFSYSDHEAVMARLKISWKHNGVGGGHMMPRNNCPFGGLGTDDIQCDIQTESCAAAADGHACSDDVITKATTHITTDTAARTVALQEAITLCDASLLQLHTDRLLYYGAASVLFVLLVVLAEFPVPLGFRTLNLVLKLIVFGVILFCAFMGSIWNFMERNGVLQGKKSMEIMLQHAQKYEYYY